MKATQVVFPLLTLLFTAVSCNTGTKYVYLKSNNQKIMFIDRPNRPDLFELRWDYGDLDGEFIDISLMGDFNKDSVDQAVENYMKNGVIPTFNDLQ